MRDVSDGDAGRTSILLFGIHVVARTVGFVGLVVFTRLLPKERLDVYFLFFLVVQMASMVSNLGMGQALVRRISEGERESAVFSAALTTVAAASVLLAGAFFAFDEALAAYIGADVAGLLALATGFWLLADLHLSAIQGEDRVLVSGLLQLLQDVVRVGVGAAFLFAGYGPVGLMYGVVVAFAATSVIGYPLTSLTVTRPTRRDFRRLFDISRHTMFFGPANFVYFWLDTFMIGLLLPAGNVSAYEVAWQTTRVLILANVAINQTVFPKVSRWASQGRYGEIERVIPGVVLFSLVFPLPGVVGVVVIGEEVLSVVYRPTYAVAAVPMAILAGYMAVESLQRISSSVLTGMDRAEVPFRARLTGVALAAVLNVTLIPTFGLVGAAVATFAAKLVDTALQWRFLAGEIDVDVPRRSLGWQVGSAALMGATVFLGARWLRPSTTPVLLALVAGGVLVYGLTVLFDDEIRGVVGQYVPVPLGT